jgi:hypothetical protein
VIPVAPFFGSWQRRPDWPKNQQLNSPCLSEKRVILGVFFRFSIFHDRLPMLVSGIFAWALPGRPPLSVSHIAPFQLSAKTTGRKATSLAFH